ncbi:hypothetical protein BDZ91DRAFT_786810 [Kalaharituber pfeilii]|nr:hypothetical protein BDZ91DRAFT_786810 [Kalaharituber pfeilii]
MADWTGGDPDHNGIYPSQLLLGQQFVLPYPTGGKSVIAIARSQEIYITSLYALIVNAIFAAWWVLISIAIPHLIPQCFIHEPSIAIITSWKINEPLQALFPLVHHLWHIISSYCKSRRAKQARQYLSIQLVKFSWGDFTITLVTFILALGTFVCGIVASIFLSKTFVLNAALANPDKLFYPTEALGEARNVFLLEERIIAERAITVVDNADPYGSTRKLLDSRVFFETIPTDPPSDRHNESSYSMRYTSSVTGYDMGLIYAVDLNITTHGKCDFVYDVDVLEPGTEAYSYFNGLTFSVHNVSKDARSPAAYFACDLAPRGNFTTAFSVIPKLWGLRYLNHSSIYTDPDPWYFPDTAIGSIKSSRPMIQCYERVTVSYPGWEGTFSDLRDNRIPGLHVSTVVIRILDLHFGSRICPTCWFGWYLPNHLTLGSVRNMLEVPRLLLLDSEVTAASDIRRLVEGVHLYSKERFKVAALAYARLMNKNSSRKDVIDPHLNLLRTAEGEPVASEFILYTENAAALRFETLVAVPAVLVFSWILVALCWQLRLSPPDSKGGEIADDTCKAKDGKPGWRTSVETLWR